MSWGSQITYQRSGAPEARLVREVMVRTELLAGSVLQDAPVHADLLPLSHTEAAVHDARCDLRGSPH